MTALTRAETELLARDPDLTALRLVLDDHALAAAVARLPDAPNGRPAVRRLRYKPDASVQAAVEVPGAPSRWFLLAGYTPSAAPKLAKDRQVARAGTLVDEEGGWLVAPALSDRHIRAGRLLRGRTAHPLAYNPRRRLVLREPVGSGETGLGRIVKVYARDCRRASRRLLHDLAVAGVALPTAAVDSPSRSMHVVAWTPGRHSDPGADGPVVRTALDVLHGVPIPEDAARWDTAELVARTMAAAASTSVVLPSVAEPAVELARRIADRLPGADLGPVGTLHGDFSADQVLVEEGSATLLDLDDCTSGPRAWDAATWLAAQLAGGALDAVPLPGPEPVPELYAAALALRVVEPFRRRQPAWELTTARLIAQGHAVLDAAVGTRCVGSAARHDTEPARPVRPSAAPRRQDGGGVSGLAALLPPLPAATGGERFDLRRAWPDGERVVLELSAPGGWVHAGYWRLGTSSVQLVPAADDRALPGLAALLATGGTLVGHRLGKRAVVQTSEGYAKVVRPSRVAQAAARHTAVRTALAPVLGAPRVADLLEVDEAGGVLRFAALPGESLEHIFGGGDADEAAQIGRRLGSALRSFGTARPVGLPAHGARDEMRVLRDWHARALGFDLLVGADRCAFEALAWQAMDLLAALDGEPRAARTGRTPPNGSRRPRAPAGVGADTEVDPTPADLRLGRLVHRDLHLGQLLATRTGLGLLDLDTTAIGDPALDVGNLLAHVDLEVAAGRCAPAIATAFGDGMLGRLAVDEQAVAAYRVSTCARLVAVHAFRPDAARVVPALLALATSPAAGHGPLCDASHIARRRADRGRPN